VFRWGRRATGSADGVRKSQAGPTRFAPAEAAKGNWNRIIDQEVRMKKTYSTPKLATFGTVEALTKGLGIGNELLFFSKDLI
jgi:hypothetical protein